MKMILTVLLLVAVATLSALAAYHLLSESSIDNESIQENQPLPILLATTNTQNTRSRASAQNWKLRQKQEPRIVYSQLYTLLTPATHSQRPVNTTHRMLARQLAFLLLSLRRKAHKRYAKKICGMRRPLFKRQVKKISPPTYSKKIVRKKIPRTHLATRQQRSRQKSRRAKPLSGTAMAHCNKIKSKPKTFLVI